MFRWLWDRLLERGERDDPDSDGAADASASDDGTVWDLTPDWQIGGYRLQGASASRDEQRQAVAEVHEQASEMERELDDR
ncbi:hypothetical protein SAMN06269185_2525 [Natronoarchaeum philippinense]|uniref:Uncharacterized protein n=1 Tax=Natronoarchaeum philippinense TaxID=558529 RepID=A0A285P1I5_NATPI|nr:hypothetical protein [Natronoarchaeum philippinense]SNZ15589.1 hypothetical protein SAMN06269185_2525 [Natronoarchaeum philippinense]